MGKTYFRRIGSTFDPLEESKDQPTFFFLNVAIGFTQTFRMLGVEDFLREGCGGSRWCFSAAGIHFGDHSCFIRLRESPWNFCWYGTLPKILIWKPQKWRVWRMMMFLFHPFRAVSVGESNIEMDISSFSQYRTMRWRSLPRSFILLWWIRNGTGTRGMPQARILIWP